PLLQRLDDLRPSAEEQAARESGVPLVLVLPGSRHSELKRLLPTFGDVLAQLAELRGRIDFVLPTLPRFADELAVQIEHWPVKPRIVIEDEEKHTCFRRARAALAASGTVTLELALARVPTVAAYRVSAIEAPILRRAIRAPSTIL